MMTPRKQSYLRLVLTGVVTLAALAWLAWQYFHGGVESHHLLHRRDLPAISNWWSALVLPGLTWFLLGRILRRTVSSSDEPAVPVHLPARIFVRFLLSLLFGALFAVAFTNGEERVTSYMFLSLFPLALIFPVYMAEYVLGFVLGMTVAFGAVLPTLVACVFAGLSMILRFLVGRAYAFIAGVVSCAVTTAALMLVMR